MPMTHHSEPVTTNFVLARNRYNASPLKEKVEAGALKGSSLSDRAFYFKFARNTMIPSFIMLTFVGTLWQYLSFASDKPYVSIFGMALIAVGVLFIHLAQMFDDRSKLCETNSKAGKTETNKEIRFSRGNLWSSLIFVLILNILTYCLFVWWMAR